MIEGKGVSSDKQLEAWLKKARKFVEALPAKRRLSEVEYLDEQCRSRSRRLRRSWSENPRSEDRAAEVFLNPLVISIHDEKRSFDEERWITAGDIH